jgi:hypothetical protein
VATPVLPVAVVTPVLPVRVAAAVMPVLLAAAARRAAGRAAVAASNRSDR